MTLMMSATAPSLELATAQEAAQRAGEIILDAWGGALQVETKADGTPVTEVDRACEVAIRALITERFPEDDIWGEEQGHQSSGAGRTWLVDPIDGTKSFVRGYPFFSVQIALQDQDGLCVGVSHAPVYGETAWAERGCGAFMDGIRLQVSDIATLERASVSTGNLRSMAQGPQWPALGGLLAVVDRTRGYGDFLHYHLLASGRIDVVIESDLNILDIAALAVIITEAGGRVTRLDGGPIDLSVRDLLATNGVLHPAVLGRLDGEATPR
jgi:histidinol-phosphatase